MAAAVSSTLATMPEVLAHASARGVTKVVIAIDLRDGYDEDDGRLRCSGVAQQGPTGNIVASRKGCSFDDTVLMLLAELGVIV